MSDETTEILMVSFGGPTPGCCKKFDDCPGEAHCFVSGIFGHNPARAERVAEVVEHYKALGGFSKFNQLTEAQGAAIKEELAKRGVNINIRSAYHHWTPHVSEKIQEYTSEGVGEFLILIMSPHQSSVSWDAYVRIVGEALEAAGGGAPKALGVVDPYWNQVGFVNALADNTRTAAEKIGADLSVSDVAVLFSAHAVPESLAKTSPYCDQIRETSELVAEKLGGPRNVVAYQSQPEDSQIPWTTPFLEQTIEKLAGDGIKKIVAVPVGFLCDNVEVLYDLGVEGEEAAKAQGIEFARADAVNSHPAFISMLADQVEAKLKEVQASVS